MVAATATTRPVGGSLFTPSTSQPKAAPSRNKKKNPVQHLIAGGCAGLVESSACHPLDTIKTRMQLHRMGSNSTATTTTTTLQPTAFHQIPHNAARMRSLHEPASLIRSSLMSQMPKAALHGRTGAAVAAPIGPIGMAQMIIRREGFLNLYKGLTAVYTGIIPKMAIRFLSFEQYRELLQNANTSLGGTAPPRGQFAPSVTFFAGLASGLTEAILVVTPAEVCKIRMQSQFHGVDGPLPTKAKYTNVLQTAVTIVREEGLGALYKGVVPTMLRQGCNQAVNFSAYNFFKRKILDRQGGTELLPWQSLMLGGLSGGMGPLVNNPLDVVKTHMQKQVITPGTTPKYTGLVQSCYVIAMEEGYMALWKGITPRLLRIMPGQAITFMTYEAVSSRLHVSFG